jgi:hypothetical protein
VDVPMTVERTRILAGDLHQLSPFVEVHACIAGRSPSRPRPAPWSSSHSIIRPTSHDRRSPPRVYENNLGAVQLGDGTHTRLNAIPTTRASRTPGASAGVDTP